MFYTTTYMRNIFVFIRRYIVFLLFIALQGISLWFLFTYNRTHRAKGLGVANQLTGWFNTRYNTVEDFFRMKEENKRLHYLNDSLRNLQAYNFTQQDTTKGYFRDSIPFDSTGSKRLFTWTPAQVVYNTVNSEKNYLQINKGSAQGIKDDMGVFSSNGGLVGKVVNVGTNFSQVMTLLHVQNNVNVLLKKTGNAGRLSWDAQQPGILTLNSIPKSDSVLVGDTIITGKFSNSYPAGMMVGRVIDIVKDKTTNFYVLKIKATANFATLQQVSVVENLHYDEMQKLNQETQKKVNDIKTATNR